VSSTEQLLFSRVLPWGGIVTADISMRLDRERRGAGEPSSRGGVVRAPSPDGAQCRIAYSSCTAEEIQGVIRDEIARAEAGDCGWPDQDDAPKPRALRRVR